MPDGVNVEIKTEHALLHREDGMYVVKYIYGMLYYNAL